MGFDILDFIRDIDFKKTDNILGNILKESVKTLQRPLGAVEGALSHYPDYRDIFTNPSQFADDFADQYKGAYEGFKNPEQQNVENIGLVKNTIGRLPDPIRKPAELATETALDPTSYLGVGLVGKGKFLGPVGEALFSPVVGRDASLGRRIGGELATNLGARFGSEAAAKATEGTPFQGAAGIAGGIIGGGVAAGAVAKGIKTEPIRPAYQSMVEEQLEQGNIFDYLDNLKKNGNEAIVYSDGFPVVNKQYFIDSMGPEQGLAQWEQYLNNNSTKNSLLTGIYKLKSDYQDAIDSLYDPQLAKDIEIFNNQAPVDTQTVIRPNMNIIPKDYAVKNTILDNSHNPFTTRFHSFTGKNEDVDRMLRDWITGGANPGRRVRQAFEEAHSSSQVLYNSGQDWRNWVQNQPESDFIKDINGGRYVLLYRGEKNEYFQLPDGRQYRYVNDDSDHLAVYNPDDGTTNEYFYSSNGNYADTKTGDVISHDLIGKAKETSRPIFDKSQSVYSMTTDPDVAAKDYFNSSKKILNPETGREEWKRFILAQWVPVDDIIGPVGRDSTEHEFLVMDRNLIPDESYQSVTGHAKDAPRSVQYTTTTKEELPKPELIKVGTYAFPNNEHYWEENGKYYHSYGLQDEGQLITKDIYDYAINSTIPSDHNIYKGKPEYLAKEITTTHPDLASAEKAIGPQPVLVQKGDSVNSDASYFWQDGDKYYNQIVSKSSGEKGIEREMSKEGWLNLKENSPEFDVYEGRPSAKVGITGFGGYDKSGIASLNVPRNNPTITTGSGYDVTYNFDDGGPIDLNQPLVDKNGFETKIEKDPDTGNFIAKTSEDGSTIEGKDFYDIVDALHADGFKPKKNFIDKVAGFFGGNKAGFAEETPNVSPKSNIKLQPSQQPSNVLAANTVQPEIPTPPPTVNEVKPVRSLTTKDIIDGFMTTHGLNKDIATQLSSLSKKERGDLANQVVNALSVKGPQEDIIRTVINGFTKAGKGDSGKLAMANNALRGLWATGDGSWFGIQGLLSIPHMLVTGRFGEATDVMTTSMRIMAGDKNTFRKFVTRKLETLPPDAPSLNEAVSSGLHLSFLKGNQDLDFNIVERLTGNRLQPDAAFAAAGDIARINEFYNTWRRYKGSDNLDLSAISRAVNRGTGIAEKPFGGYIGSFALFAPRFFQSQLEVIQKSFIDGGIEGNLARRQMISLLGTGLALTVAANELRGYDTTFDPTDPNFMRIRNVAGQDVSVFGPWDSLAKLVVHLGQGDFDYARTKFGPLATVATNLMMGENFRGEPFPPTGDPLHASAQLAKSMLLPFAWQDVGEGGVAGQSLNFFGVKSSPLSNQEKIDSNMQNLGLDPNDPLDRRQFLADHPEMRSLVKPEAIQANNIRTDIQARQLMNEQQVTDGTISLTDFRENRKILSRELRNKLDIVNQGNDFKADTQQKRWIEDYYSLFDKSADPITGDIIGQKFDQLESQWIAANGPGAYDYVQRYLGIGKNPVESQYLSDMNQLDQLGYFDTPKYDESIYESGLTDDQIDDYRNRVSSARNVNPDLARLSFKQAAYEVLGDQLNDDQIYAIILAGSEKYANPQIADLKALYPQLFLWFNPNASWSDYQTLSAMSEEDKQYLAEAS